MQGLFSITAGLKTSTSLLSLPMQLSLRLKAMKRQVEEAEEEIDRLESSKKKLQRELEEQMDVNEQLQGQLSSMKKNLRWVSAVTPQAPSPLAFEESAVLLGHPHFCSFKPVSCCCLLGVIPS